MSTLKTSWRCSLAATALWALLGNNPCQAVADDQPAEKSPSAATDRNKLYQQFQSMSQRIQQLEKDGKHDEAERLKREATELYTKMSPHRPEDGPPGSNPSNPEREKLRQHWLSLRQKVEQLKKEGRHDEAEHLKREVQEIQADLYPRPPEAGSPASRRPQTSSREMEAKLQHLRAAAENLRAAGFGEQADNITRMMQRLQGEARERDRPRPESPPREIMELRSEVQQMRREMQELREQLKRLIEQQGNRK